MCPTKRSGPGSSTKASFWTRMLSGSQRLLFRGFKTGKKLRAPQDQLVSEPLG